jgi:ABC-2 type transport system ATP-binding protein
MNSIEVRGLTKMFGELSAVDNVSFDVKRGEIFGLLGPNGAGKTTLIRMLSTLTKPSAGSASIGGHDIVRDDAKVRGLIGLVSEKIIMYDHLTARENLRFFGKLYDVPTDVLNRRIDDLLELVQLSRWGDTQVGTFSTGMRQRMNVIRALLNMPQVLFLDEPTLGLDPQSSVEIREFARKINRDSKVTIIITTHMMVEADMLCHRIGIMDQGRIINLDTSANLKRLISGAEMTILELDIPNLTPDLLSFVRSLECVTAVSHDNPTQIKVHAKGDEAFDTILDTIRGHHGRIKSVKSLEPSLEDVFLKITGHEVRDSANGKSPPSRRHGFSMPRSRIR